LSYATPAGQVKLFVEVQHRPPELIIVGAGHIAQPLAQLGKLCDFSVTVLDDRPQYAHRQRFPQADQVLALPLRETMREWAAAGRLGLDSYIVLVTRGHQHDIDCLLELLDTPLGYIGMIGSQRRVRTVFDLLSTETEHPGPEVRPRLCAHRHRHRRPHAGRDRRLHHGRDHQRAARRPGAQHLRRAHARSCSNGAAGGMKREDAGVVCVRKRKLTRNA
jgi:hypothetical protein